MKKYHSEKDPFRDRTMIYDEHGICLSISAELRKL